MSQGKGSEAQVVAWLKNHPDFFNGRDDLLKELYIPHSSGQAISLLERQNELLRRDLAHQRERLQHLMATALDNDHLFLRLRNLVLRLLEAADWPTLLQSLEQEMTHRFDVDAVRVLVGPDFPGHSSNPVQRALGESEPAMVPKVMASGQPWCGSLSDTDATGLLSDPSASGGSVALAPLRAGREPQAVLALYALDSEHFYSGMDTVFLMHLADVMARLAEKHS